jgi:hypothetical protein
LELCLVLQCVQVRSSNHRRAAHLLPADVNNAAPFAGPFQRDAQLGMSKFLTALLQKKGSPGELRQQQQRPGW